MSNEKSRLTDGEIENIANKKKYSTTDRYAFYDGMKYYRDHYAAPQPKITGADFATQRQYDEMLLGAFEYKDGKLKIKDAVKITGQAPQPLPSDDNVLRAIIHLIICESETPTKATDAIIKAIRTKQGGEG